MMTRNEGPFRGKIPTEEMKDPEMERKIKEIEEEIRKQSKEFGPEFKVVSFRLPEKIKKGDPLPDFDFALKMGVSPRIIVFYSAKMDILRHNWTNELDKPLTYYTYKSGNDLLNSSPHIEIVTDKSGKSKIHNINSPEKAEEVRKIREKMEAEQKELNILRNKLGNLIGEIRGLEELLESNSRSALKLPQDHLHIEKEDLQRMIKEAKEEKKELQNEWRKKRNV